MKSVLFFWLISKFKSRKLFYSHLLIATTLISIENFQFAKPAQAQTSTLACNNIYVSVKSGSPTNTYPTGKQFHQLDWSNGNIGSQIGASISGVTGGIGINPITKLLYYIDGNGGSGYSGLGRIYSFNGSTSSSILATIADPTTEHQAGMDLSGVLWATKYDLNKNLYSYDPTTNTVSSKGAITTSSGSPSGEWTALAEGDFAFDKNDLMWYVSTYQNKVAIWTVNRSTRVATKIGNYGSITGTNHVVTGGAFGPDGKLYIGTSLGAIYKFDTALNTLALISNTSNTITDMTSCMYPSINISGNVWHDQDNSAQNTFSNIRTGSETGTNGGGLNAFLIDANNKVIASAAVDSDGSYSFPALSGNQSGLKIRLSTNSATIGSTAPTASTPSGWQGTTPLEISSLNTGTTNISNQDFGIAQFDYGDAPSAFGDARHIIPTTPTVYLGSVQPDKESGTQLGADAGATAAGDDGNGTDDEDAFTALAIVSSVGNYTINVPVTNTSANLATLHAWVDFNKNGKFELGEYKSATVANNSTNVSLNWAIPIGTLPGNTHARFRLTTDNTLTDNTTTTTIDERSIGNANDGEVEDYKVEIADNDPFGSCPAPAYISQGSSNTKIKLYSVDLFGGGLSPISVSDISGGINAIGFSQKDRYIYGMKIGTTIVTRLDKSGVATELGTVTGLPSGSYNVGDIDSNGVLYVAVGSSTTIYGIDITPNSPNYLKVIQTINNSVNNIQDFAFHPTNGKLYAIRESSGKIYEISWPSGTTVSAIVVDRGKPTNLPSDIAYGGVFFAVDGSFYGYRNGTNGSNDGQIYRITNVVGTGLPIATLITSSATGVSRNDGARCPFAPPIYPPNSVDYGDASDTGDGTGVENYRTRALDNGPVHEIIAGLRIGSNVDGDSGSLQNNTATDDDNNGSPNDEDGVTSFPTLYTNAGTSYSVPVNVTNTTGSNAYLVGYIDFNKDGDFDDANEKSTVVTVPNNPTGNQTVVFTTPTGMTVGKTYARFRLSSTSAEAESSVGIATSGEVEDYQVAITRYDYGDAPTGYEGTNAARHMIASSLRLGDVAPDDESAAQSSANADGDNAVAPPNVNDEDGVSSFPTLKTDATSYSLTVKVNNPNDSPAKVYGWIDFDRDNEFDEDEQGAVSSGTIILDSNDKVPTGSSGTVTLTWDNIGSTGADITDGNSFIRLRLTTDNLNLTTETTARDDASIGSATNGEVEDYKIAIAFTENPDLPANFCQASSSSRNLLFILDDSSSVDDTEIQQQRDAVMASLNDFVAKNLTGKAAIVAFDSVGNTVINYTNITAANLSTFQTALNTNYGDYVSGTHWEKGFQTGINLPGGIQPNVVFFFTDGTNNSGNSPNGQAAQLKATGAHIYGIGIQGLTVEDGFRGITNGNNTIIYNGSNALEADFLAITDYSTLQNQYTNAFLKNLCPADFGDAPDTYGTDNIANNNTNPLGANHDITPGLFLGATAPDTDANGFVDGIDDNSGNAIDDDAPIGTGSGNGGDEGGFIFPILKVGKPTYTIPANNIITTNTTTQSATLHAWIDFDKNGKFDSTEYASAAVGINGVNPQTNLTWSGITVGSTGNTYARFRLTSDNAINNTTPGGNANDGEVEDYKIAIAQASDPKLLLVKRITAINPGQPGAILFNNFIDDPGTTNDNNSKWPDSDGNPSNNTNSFLRGEINVPSVKPADEVEYTVYFLSSGDENAKDVKICDVVPDHMTFVKNTYGVELGIGLGFNSTVLPTFPNLKLSNLLNDDQADFYAPGTVPPTNLCKKVTPANTLVNVNGTNNDNGAIVLKIQDLPKANTPGSPASSYGFIRFRGKVK